MLPRQHSREPEPGPEPSEPDGEPTAADLEPGLRADLDVEDGDREPGDLAGPWRPQQAGRLQARAAGNRTGSRCELG